MRCGRVAYGLAQGAVGNGHGTLPAGAGPLFARHRAAVEVERCGVEVLVFEFPLEAAVHRVGEVGAEGHIVHGNLNIRENRKCGEISLLGLRKGHMIWNCNHLKYCPGTINGAETMNNIHTLLF